ncbi:MAG: NAD(P)-binding domain-containing protein [Raoultibacter sp.]
MGKSFVFIGDTKVGDAVTENLIEAGFLAAPDMGSADVVFTFCESQTATEDVYFETGGLIQKGKKGAYLVDLGSTSPAFSKELQAVALVNDMHAVDAPLFVRDIVIPGTFSRRDNLAIFVGGEQDDFVQLTAFFDAIATTVDYRGAAGSGQMTKAVLSLHDTAQVISLMEAEALCRIAGYDPVSTIDAAMTTETVSPRIAALHRAVTDHAFTSGYTLQILMGELVAALSAADDIDLILPQAEAAMHLLDLLAIIGGAEMSPAALSLLYGDEAECAQYGLDWTRAEATYGSDGHDDECNCDDDECDCDDHDDDYAGGFGGYSAN